jgi:signal transduction histidine kinase
VSNALRPLWRSFRVRSVAASVAVLLILWGGWALWQFREAGRINSRFFDQELKATAEVVLSVFPRSIASRGPAGNFRLAEEPSWPATDLNFQAWSRDQRLITRTGITPNEPLNPSFRTGFSTIEIDGGTWRVYSLNDADNEIQIQVGDQIAQRRDLAALEARDGLRSLSIIMIPLGLGLLLAGWWSTLPLRRLQRAVEARDTDDVRPLPTAGLPLETLPLVDAFNEMLARAGQAREAQRRFVADAAHELRTPIAALRVQAQVALRTDDMAQREQALKDLLAGIDRNTRVAEQLLELARMDTQSLRIVAPQSMVDVAAIAQNAIHHTHALAAKRNVRIQSAIPQLRVHSEQTMLSAVIRNLLDNAVRYTRANSVVTLHGAVKPEQCELWIDDEGPGLSAKEAERALQPFVRLTTGEEPGSGLGLSIVARACALLDHQLKLERLANGEGLRAAITFRTSLRDGEVSTT